MIPGSISRSASILSPLSPACPLATSMHPWIQPHLLRNYSSDFPTGSAPSRDTASSPTVTGSWRSLPPHWASVRASVGRPKVLKWQLPLRKTDAASLQGSKNDHSEATSPRRKDQARGTDVKCKLFPDEPQEEPYRSGTQTAELQAYPEVSEPRRAGTRQATKDWSRPGNAHWASCEGGSYGEAESACPSDGDIPTRVLHVLQDQLEIWVSLWTQCWGLKNTDSQNTSVRQILPGATSATSALDLHLLVSSFAICKIRSLLAS